MFSFLFGSKKDPAAMDVDSAPQTAVTEEPASISTRHGEGSPSASSYRDLRTPSPPASIAPSTTADVTKKKAAKKTKSAKSSRPMKPLPSTSSPQNSNHNRTSSDMSFKLPPSPTSLPLGKHSLIPPSPVDFEARTAKTLQSLLKTVPAKTLHDYFIQRVNDLSASELISLSSILSDLEPPPQLHCVRCHRAFTDVENTHHSCTIAHDDDSAVVQYASLSHSKAYGGLKGHETFWGCCGQTVEGEGELGPPRGWCYEGLHTIDQKRARWRDDSTLADDKLTSCEERGCFKEEEVFQARGRETRRKRMREDNEDELVPEKIEPAPESRRKASPAPSAVSVRSTRSTAVKRRKPRPASRPPSKRAPTPPLSPSALSLSSPQRIPTPEILRDLPPSSQLSVTSTITTAITGKKSDKVVEKEKKPKKLRESMKPKPKSTVSSQKRSQSVASSSCTTAAKLKEVLLDTPQVPDARQLTGLAPDSEEDRVAVKKGAKKRRVS